MIEDPSIHSLIVYDTTLVSVSAYTQTIPPAKLRNLVVQTCLSVLNNNGLSFKDWKCQATTFSIYSPE